MISATEAISQSRLPGWKSIFRPALGSGPAVTRREMVILSKAGEPLLVLPRQASAALQALSLYPAQTARARLARRFCYWVFKLRLAVMLNHDSVAISPDDPLVPYLRRLARTTDLPVFALLAGNPSTPGRRFLLLIFDAQLRPVAVVKAGAGRPAITLIEQEIALLQSLPPNTPGIPKIREQFQTANLCAFALDFVEGDSPRADQDERVALLLNAWLDQRATMPVFEFKAWRRLARTSAGDPVVKKLARTLQRVEVHPAISHGDFTPWNIKISPGEGSVTVLDWERGELQGVPGWDWFHFVIQRAILVQRQSAATLVHTAETLLDSAFFGNYAQAAGVAEVRQEWLLAYLLHCRDVLGLGPISPKIPQLLNVLVQRWDKG